MTLAPFAFDHPSSSSDFPLHFAMILYVPPDVIPLLAVVVPEDVSAEPYVTDAHPDVCERTPCGTHFSVPPSFTSTQKYIFAPETKVACDSVYEYVPPLYDMS